VVNALNLFVDAMLFVILTGPQSVAVEEHWMENFSVPWVGLELDHGVATVDVIQLDRLPR
jgi:hypothetical protein